MVISLNVLVDSIYNILIFFAEKNVSSFCTAKVTHIFSAQKKQKQKKNKKKTAYLRITQCKF